MNQYTFIANPEAGRGHARKLLQPLLDELQARRVDFEMHQTSCPGQALDLARACTSPVVVSVGGDGTLNEIINGLSGKQRAIGIIPAGSGNDFIKSLGIPKGLGEALDVVLGSSIRSVDAGVITCTSSAPEGRTVEARERMFINGVGVGFDAAVAAKMRTIKYLGGTAVYVMAVLQTLGKFEAPRFQITIDRVERSSCNLLIAIGNGRCAGGGFYLTPEARVDDGQLDLCIIDDVSVPTILRLMPLVMIARHTHRKEVLMARARERIEIRGDRRFFVHADGEVIGEWVDRVSVTIRPRYLPILAPASSSQAAH